VWAYVSDHVFCNEQNNCSNYTKYITEIILHEATESIRLFILNLLSSDWSDLNSVRRLPSLIVPPSWPGWCSGISIIYKVTTEISHCATKLARMVLQHLNYLQSNERNFSLCHQAGQDGAPTSQLSTK